MARAVALAYASRSEGCWGVHAYTFGSLNNAAGALDCSVVTEQASARGVGPLPRSPGTVVLAGQHLGRPARTA